MKSIKNIIFLSLLCMLLASLCAGDNMTSANFTKWVDETIKPHINYLLVKAINKNDVAEVRRLLNLGADVDVVGEFWLSDLGRSNGTALMIAANKGYLEIVQALIAAKADVDKAGYNGHTALMLAVDKGYLEIVQALIAAKADVNQCFDWHGLWRTWRTALILAVNRGYLDIVHALIDAKANVNKVDYGGMAALHWAARRGNFRIAQALIEAKADVNLVDNEGHNALMFAALSCDFQIMLALIKAGADVTQVDKEGRTVLDIARQSCESDEREIIKLLEEVQAKQQQEKERCKQQQEKAQYKQLSFWQKIKWRLGIRP